MVSKQLKMPKLAPARVGWWRPDGVLVKKMIMGGLLVVAMVGAFCWGRYGASNQARGQTPAQPWLDPGAMQQSPQGNGHVVAYIYHDTPITREELGEYLIERCGPDRLEFLVNRKIIDRACAAKNIHITEAEINAQFAEDLKAFQCTEREFATKVLRPHNKTLFEWREDVIRPKLALQRLVQDRIVISEKDIQDGFEAKFGPKVECRLIVLGKEQIKDKYDIWARASRGQAEFEKEAKTYNPGPLAAEGGKVPPIHMHFADPNIERAAFQLKPGEVSPLIGMNDGTTIILYCEKQLAADPNKKLEQERLPLNRELFEGKVAQSIPQVFAELRKEAAPQIFLKKEFATADVAGLRPDIQLPVATPPQTAVQPPPSLPPSSGLVAPPSGPPPP